MRNKFRDEHFANSIEKIADDGKRMFEAIWTYEEILNSNYNEQFVSLEEIKEENYKSQKRNTDNFLNSDVINKFKNDNFLNSLYMTHMKNKSLWKPDKFKQADRVVNSFKQK